MVEVDLLATFHEFIMRHFNNVGGIATLRQLGEKGQICLLSFEGKIGKMHHLRITFYDIIIILNDLLWWPSENEIWILRSKFWANTYMTKMAIKLPQYVKNNLFEIIKIDKPHKKGRIIKNFSNYLQIFMLKIQRLKVFQQQVLHQYTCCQHKNITSL